MTDRHHVSKSASDARMRAEGLAHSERLRAPLSWWLLAAGFAGSVWLAYHHAYGASVSLPAGGAALALSAAGLIWYGRARVAVTPDGFVAGRAMLPMWATGEVSALDADQTRAARGRDADPRAYLVIRGYIPGTVKVEVDDPADPVPYWLISTRHPERLARALTRSRS